MRTLFDIGDKIEFTITGKVKSISLNKDGDCYVVYLNDKERDGIPVYLNSEILIKTLYNKL